MMNVNRSGAKVIYKNLLLELHNPAGVRVTDEEVMDYAKSSGCGFVKLRYNGATSSGVLGFQNGILTISRGRNGVELRFNGKTEGGKADRTAVLEFKPDKLGVLWAFVPKLEANLKILAACSCNNSADWEIVDENDRKEISKLADKYTKELGWSREKVKKTTVSSFRQIAQEEAKKIDTVTMPKFSFDENKQGDSPVKKE